jgi:predicted deacetylase
MSLKNRHDVEAGSERFHKLRALSGIEQGGFFLMKKPLSGSGFGIQQLWNRCNDGSRHIIADESRIHHEGKCMIPRPAQYLLRFDDLCPTIEHDHWLRCLPMIEEFGLRPILAVVPDNRDHSLNLSMPDPMFWPLMRAMEAEGATIALHGYSHICSSKAANILKLHHHSEFAGVAEDTQRRWIREGLGVLRGQGLTPRIFVAPRHGFDHATLRALRKEGIPLISDGFARIPFNRGGITWIPQQLWRPVEKSGGIWTICIHSNFIRAAQVEELRVFIRRHAAQFTSLDRVLAEYSPGRLGPIEKLYESWALWRAQARRARRRRKLHPR